MSELKTVIKKENSILYLPKEISEEIRIECPKCKKILPLERIPKSEKIFVPNHREGDEKESFPCRISKREFLRDKKNNLLFIVCFDD